MTASSVRTLFVYGTLMRAAAGSEMGREQRLRLERAGQWLGEAQINGRLFDRGTYPFLVASRVRRDIVHGEVYRLRAPAMTFRLLDLYEAIPPGRTKGAAYERVTRPVHLASGETTLAWVYLQTGPIGRACRIVAGRWRPPEAGCGRE